MLCTAGPCARSAASRADRSYADPEGSHTRAGWARPDGEIAGTLRDPGSIRPLWSPSLNGASCAFWLTILSHMAQMSSKDQAVSDWCSGCTAISPQYRGDARACPEEPAV